MYFEKEIGQGRAFMELERRADGTYGIKRRGFIQRAKGRNPVQQQQATESPLIHDGSQTVLASTLDARNSTQTGTTLNGPNGSGQFLVVVLSTVNTARTVTIASTLAGANYPNVVPYGILQNKPRGSDAADVGIFGVSKVVGGTTTILAGSQLGVSSTAAGMVNLYTTGQGARIGVALEPVLTVGSVITAAIYGFGMGAGST